MHALPNVILPDQYELSRHAADRYALVSAAKKRRTVERRAARMKAAAEAARPVAIGRVFWKRRWS